MPERVNWIEQIRRRSDEELWRWMEEVTSPRVLSMAMTELSLRSIKRLEKSMDAFAASGEKYAQRMAFVTRGLILSTVVLILVALLFAFVEARKIFWEAPPRASATAPVRAQAASVSSYEAECAGQAGRAIVQFTHQQLDKTLNFKVLSSENHYNKELRKCLVEMRTFGGDHDDVGMGNYVLDAYENSVQLYCFTPVRPRPDQKYGQCYDHKSSPIPREEADKQIMQLMER